MRKIVIAGILWMFVIMNVGAQLGIDVVKEDFNDDTTDANDFNIIPGSNPDEDWYFFDVTDFTSGDGCRMKVEGPFNYTGQLDITSNHLRTQANTPGVEGDCDTQIYTLAFDEEEPVEIIQASFGWVGGQIAKHNVMEFLGGGQLIGALCQSGVDIFLTTAVDSTCGSGVLIEDFEDDTAVATGNGVNNVSPGSNPDENWYFFLPLSTGCDTGTSRLHVATPGSVFAGSNSLSWSTNAFVAGASNSAFPGCPRNNNQFVLDTPSAITEFDIQWGVTSSASGQLGGRMIVEGEGVELAILCVTSGGQWRLLGTGPSSFCSATGGHTSFGGTNTGGQVHDLNWQINWTAQTVTVQFVSSDCSTGNPCTGGPTGTAQTVPFINTADVMEILQVDTYGSFNQDEQIHFIDNYSLQIPLTGAQELLEETSDIACLVDYEFLFDWVNESMSAEVIGFSPECSDITLGANATIPFANSLPTMNSMRITTGATGSDDQVTTVLDDVIIKGLVVIIPPVSEPVDLQEGVATFAQEFGFKTGASQMLFAIFVIGGCMIVTASITHFFSDSKYKNWVLLGVGVGVSSFFIFIQFIDVWELTIATVLGGASVQGIREALSNIRLPGPVPISRGIQGSPVAEVQDVDLSLGSVSGSARSEDSLKGKMEAVEEQIREERRERESNEDS